MSDLIEKIFVVEGEEIEFRSEIKERMERVFNDAVDNELHAYYTDGIDVVLDTMAELNMSGSSKLVEQRLSEKKILVSGDRENENDEEDETNREKKKRNPKRGTVKEGSEFESAIAKIIG